MGTRDFEALVAAYRSDAPCRDAGSHAVHPGHLRRCRLGAPKSQDRVRIRSSSPGVMADYCYGFRDSRPDIRQAVTSRSQRLVIFLTSLCVHTLQPKCRSRRAVFLELACYLSVEKPGVPMMFRCTKPLSPRGSGMVNVKTIGGRSSRYWCCLCSGGETKPAPGLSDIRHWGAPYFLCWQVVPTILSSA